ncbi:hypothetical protein FYK55_19930 [Roseiconus nitratireducens]|uniref:Uncharacterized protein n=1 Tax=Roseiconus nitratireducens TaxID=2605748 RepID=A0A5M6D663_9BACT|nr:hypothetical protein [Roseiconus nitratireducens]KAA5540665.1 hypothetical protein FYK55_19930 [Roseiconus nitratireducens]
MPIQIKCQCGKALAVKDQFAGKAVKCPACGKPIRVPVGGGAAASGSAGAGRPAPAAQPVGQPNAGDPLNDLFDEEGFGSNIAAVCPSCRAEMPADAVLCTKCGFNKATGQKMTGHLTPGVDISSGTLALQKAADDMRAADKMQRDMTERAGMPWWMLGLILFVLGSATALAVMAVMSANRVTGESNFNAMRTFLQLSGTACGLVAFGAFMKLVVQAFREDRTKGFLSLTVVYLLVFVFQKPKGRIGAFLVMLILGGISGALFAQSQNS